MKSLAMIVALFVITATGTIAAQQPTIYTLPSTIHWTTPPAGSKVGPGVQIAFLHGTPKDRCGTLYLWKFPNGQGMGWHVNGEYSIYTILKGILVVGFDRHHAKSAERLFPAGSVIQGWAYEPHYGRAVGETIFEGYDVCN